LLGEKIGRQLLRKEKGPAWWLFASLVLFALLVFGASSCGGTAREQSVEEGAEDEPQAGEDEEQAGADLEHPSLGSEDAPVLLIEYADYQ
jgi:hypothetical protein